MSFQFIPLLRKNKEEVLDPDERILRDYLEKQSSVKYNDHALEGTVTDVMALDSDLKEYVMHFLKTGEYDTSLGCECASIMELLETQSFTPITATLFIQWYRHDPVSAAKFLLHHDDIVDIPNDLPPCEEE